MSRLVLFLSTSSQILSLNGADYCDLTHQTCENEGYCTQSNVVLQLPDFVSTLGGGSSERELTDYGCTSTGYCEWIGVENVSCARVYIPDKYVNGYAMYSGNCIGPISAPISLNQTISCCNDGMNCTEVWEEIASNDSTYTQRNCVQRDDVAPILTEILECYGTTDFMQYTICNKSAYSNECPFFFFDHHQDYAKCSCQALSNWDNTTDYNNSYLYFSELTDTVESVFARFRGANREDCPEWQFACNPQGDALLDVFEIICPLELEEDSDLESLKQEVDEGVQSLTSDQVEIFGEYIRVLMYSEEEAENAFEWITNNKSGGVPEEIASPCTMNETLWNLNEMYGDYVPPTEDVTDRCYHVNCWISLVVGFLIANFWMA